MLTIHLQKISKNFDDVELPTFASEGSAGLDIRAALEVDCELKPGAITRIATNIAIQVPEGYECQVRSRSGLAAKHGVFCLNSPGTIDSDYRGEIFIILANFGSEPYTIKRAERIAQLVFHKYEKVQFTLVEGLDTTERGSGGFGSTGRA